MSLYFRLALTSCIALAALFTQACASKHMKQFIGRDVRYVVLEDGQPENVMDLPDGRRAFQFRWGGGTYVVPKTTDTQGQVQLVGNSAYYSERKLESGGFIVENPGCLLTYFARWDSTLGGWIVQEVSWPKKLVC